MDRQVIGKSVRAPDASWVCGGSVFQRVLSSGNRKAIETVEQQLLFFKEYIDHQAATRHKARRKSA